MAYNPNIPATGHNGAQDYSDMQGNFAQISTSYDTDHIPLNSGSNVGFHQQVTFGTNNPPSSPVSPPVMFTNTQDGTGTGLPNSVPQLFFYSGTAIQGQNNYVVGTSGSALLTMGIVIKWGVINITGNGPQPVTFISPFPNNCFCLSFSSLSTAPSINGIISFDNKTNAGFDAYQNGPASVTVTYIAIGN